MSSLDSSLAPLLQTALIGTGRGQGALRLEGPLQPFGNSTDGPEAALLGAAAAVTLSARAGQSPGRSQLPAITLCPPETQPYFSVRAATLLGSCLAEHRELVGEVLSWAAQSGQIAPPALLPRLLDLGRGSKELRRHMLPILGERGRWLAQFNPDWQSVAAPLDSDLETSWQTGPLPARREALRLLREADPAHAREWIEAALATDGAKERAQWLETLELHLSIEDEPLLEKALNDKSKEVRATAASLLQKLPTSGLVTRAKTELEPLLKWSPRSRSLEVELPATWNKDWARDGLEEKVSGYNQFRKIGDRASWLYTWLARVPPSHWESHWNASPAQIVAAIPREWRELLGSAWWDAAKVEGNTAWAVALQTAPDLETTRYQFSFAGIEAPQADALALALLDKEGDVLSRQTPLSGLLQAHPGPWGLPLAQRFLKAVRQEIAPQRTVGDGLLATATRLRSLLPNLLKGAAPDSQQEKKESAQRAMRASWLRLLLPSLGDKFPIEMAAEAASGWPDDPEFTEQWGPSLNQFLNRLQLRADLRSEFLNSTP